MIIKLKYFSDFVMIVNGVGWDVGEGLSDFLSLFAVCPSANLLGKEFV